MDDEEDSKRSQIFGEDEAAAASEPEPKRSRRMDDDEDEDYEPLPKAPPLLDRETLLEAARNTDFFEWLERFSQFSLPTLLAILGAQVPPELIAAGAPPDILLPALKSLLDRALAKRPKRPDINSIEDVLKLLQTTKNILVLTGAGVSVSCGIPDFRSANGIYSRLAEFQLDDPQQMFDIDYFKFQPKTFYTFAKVCLSFVILCMSVHSFKRVSYPSVNEY